MCVEDLNVAGIARRKGLRNGRSVAEAWMGGLVGELDYKTSDRSSHLVRVGQLYSQLADLLRVVDVVDEESGQEGGVPSRVTELKAPVGAGGEGTPDVESSA